MVSILMSALLLGDPAYAMTARQRLDTCLYSAADYLARTDLDAERVADIALAMCLPQRFEMSRASNGMMDGPEAEAQLRNAVVVRVAFARAATQRASAGR